MTDLYQVVVLLAVMVAVMVVLDFACVFVRNAIVMLRYRLRDWRAKRRAQRRFREWDAQDDDKGTTT